jgi:hypothetical protein
MRNASSSPENYSNKQLAKQGLPLVSSSCVFKVWQFEHQLVQLAVVPSIRILRVISCISSQRLCTIAEDAQKGRVTHLIKAITMCHCGICDP